MKPIAVSMTALLVTLNLGCSSKGGSAPTALTQQPQERGEPTVANQGPVNDNFRLSELLEQESATLNIAKKLLIAYQPYTASVEPSNGEAKLLPVLIYDGVYLQQTETAFVNLETRKELSTAEFSKIQLAAECEGWWTPLRPDGEPKPKDGYRLITEQTEIPMRLALKLEPQYDSAVFVHSKAAVYADQLNVGCKNVPADQLTVGHLKKLFGSPQLALKTKR